MSRMQLQADALVALFASVPGAGVIHPEEPYARSQADFQAMYLVDNGQGGKVLRGWFLRRVSTRETEGGNGRVINVHTWRLRGFMALQAPDSGRRFDAVIESLRDAYRANPTLGGAAQVGPIGQPTGIQVMDSNPVMFAGVLCHSATLQLQTYDYF